MKKGYFLYLFIFVVLTFLVACNSGEKTSGNSDDGNGTHSWRAASHVPENHPNTQALMEIANRINEESDGRIEIKIYPANQLGDYTTVYEEIGKGTIEMGSISTPSQLNKNLELVFMSYLVKNYDEVKEVYNKGSYLVDTLYEIHSDLGVKLLGFHAEGFGGIGTVEKIENLEPGEDKQMMIRVPQMGVFQKPMEDLGFNTVSIPYAELYTALQTGSADGWSGGGVTANYEEFRDVINYYYQTNDFFDASSIMINEDLWEGLDEEDQTMIQNIVDDVSSKSIEIAEENESKYRSMLEEEGIEFIELDDEELADLFNYVRENSWPKLEDRFGSEIIDKLKEMNE